MKDRRATPATVEKNMRLIDPLWQINWRWSVKIASEQVRRSRWRETARRRVYLGSWSINLNA